MPIIDCRKNKTKNRFSRDVLQSGFELTVAILAALGSRENNFGQSEGRVELRWDLEATVLP